MSKMNRYKVCGMIKTTVTGKLIYLVLDDLVGDSGEVVIPQRRLCDALRLSRSAVSRNLRRLESAGAIIIIPQYHSDGGRSANKYVVK